MKRMQQTAIHEASHLISFLTASTNSEEEYLEIMELSIIPDDDALGHLAPEILFYHSEPALMFRTYLAGYAAEFITQGHSNELSFIIGKLNEEGDAEGSDADRLIEHSLPYLKEGGSVDGFLLPIFQQVVEDLKRNWHQVDLVANLLIEKKTIEGEGLKNLANKIRGMLK